MTKQLLNAGIAMPILYFSAILIAGLLYPDFNHATQLPSELGANEAPYVWAPVFNMALIGVGLLGWLGALGMMRCLLAKNASKWLIGPLVITVVLPAVSMLMSGVFPLPSPYHASLPLLLAGVLFPVIAAIAINKIAAVTWIQTYLYTTFVASLLIVGVILGFGGLISEDNVGVWIRLWALSNIPPVGVVCYKFRSFV